jgi:hypothetical protein
MQDATNQLGVMTDALNHLNGERLQLLLAVAQLQRQLARLEAENAELRAAAQSQQPSYPPLDVPPVT